MYFLSLIPFSAMLAIRDFNRVETGNSERLDVLGLLPVRRYCLFHVLAILKERISLSDTKRHSCRKAVSPLWRRICDADSSVSSAPPREQQGKWSATGNFNGKYTTFTQPHALLINYLINGMNGQLSQDSRENSAQECHHKHFARDCKRRN